MALLNFDASTVAPSEALEAVPAGWYNAQMTASEMKPTSDGTGAYLQAEFTILSGDYVGRKLFDRINLQNKNPVAVEIGYKTLSSICHAVGVIQVADSQQLHGRPLQAKVSLRAAGPGADGKHYDASNEVKGYKAIDGAGASTAAAPTWAPQAAPAQQQYAPPAPPAAPAWQPPAQPQYAQQYAPPPPPPAQQPAPQQWAPPAQQAAPAAPAVPPWQGQPAAQAPAVGQPVAAPAAPIPPWAQPAK